jgi:hypothetical protein
MRRLRDDVATLADLIANRLSAYGRGGSGTVPRRTERRLACSSRYGALSGRGSVSARPRRGMRNLATTRLAGSIPGQLPPRLGVDRPSHLAVDLCLRPELVVPVGGPDEVRRLLARTHAQAPAHGLVGHWDVQQPFDGCPNIGEPHRPSVSQDMNDRPLHDAITQPAALQRCRDRSDRVASGFVAASPESPLLGWREV